MQTISITPTIAEAIVGDLGQSPLFDGLSEDELRAFTSRATMCQYIAGETISEAETDPDYWFLVVSGEAAITAASASEDGRMRRTRAEPYETLGELDLILKSRSSARIEAGNDTVLLRFESAFFDELFSTSPGFSRVVSRVLAKRLQATGSDMIEVPAEVVTTLAATSPDLDILLRRIVDEGASDLHLTARHVPHWRIDGIIAAIPDTEPLDSDAISALIAPILPARNKEQFLADNDTDLAYAIPGLARFRVNVFRDNHGVGAVFRQIPDTILTMQQLGLPKVVRNLCDYPKGLILVTGPTGSGKSTTLAAMIDHINETRQSHVITLEDPIEFVHPSKGCLVNQREVGPHTSSFSRALRAALREDPDIVLVGEMRDLETVALALETANTGHLVFGTLHTNTAISTISRIIDMFPAGQQNQIRSVLADSLKGVVAQTLCRKIGGGRVAALEILVSDTGVAALIRDGKTHQILSAMQTGKIRGNRLLNEELKRLVDEEIIAKEEALAKAVDKPDLMTKLGIEPDETPDEET